jgi:hypothetical protein
MESKRVEHLPGESIADYIKRADRLRKMYKDIQYKNTQKMKEEKLIEEEMIRIANEVLNQPDYESPVK